MHLSSFMTYYLPIQIFNWWSFFILLFYNFSFLYLFLFYTSWHSYLKACRFIYFITCRFLHFITCRFSPHYPIPERQLSVTMLRLMRLKKNCHGQGAQLTNPVSPGGNKIAESWSVNPILTSVSPCRTKIGRLNAFSRLLLSCCQPPPG